MPIVIIIKLWVLLKKINVEQFMCYIRIGKYGCWLALSMPFFGKTSQNG